MTLTSLAVTMCLMATAGSPPTVIPKDHLALKDGRGTLWWKARHESKLREIAGLGGSVDVVFLGDSIMQNWESRKWGQPSLEALESEWSILNLGFGGDRTQHVIWRCLNGELDGYRAKTVVLLSGTNNAYYEKLPPDTIAKGIAEIIRIVRARQPQATVLLMPLLPRYERRDDPLRLKNDRVNELIRPLADGRHVVWMDLGAAFVKADGAPDPRLFADLCHPDEDGYPVWKDAMIPYLRKYVKGGGTPRFGRTRSDRTISGDGSRLEFAPAARGFGCVSLACGDASFFRADGRDAPGLWQLEFRAGTAGTSVTVDAARASGRVLKIPSGLRFCWEGVDIEAGDNALDVFCDAVWNAERGRYEFSIKVDNRSGRYGLFSTDYPRLGSVVKRGPGTVIRPTGNWGGTRTSTPWPQKLTYPGYPASVQLAIFENGSGEGLMVAALDPKACVKFLSINDKFDFSFVTPAERAGISGAACPPAYPVALYPYTGTWWKAAKHYREWAVSNADWMKSGRNAERPGYAGRFRNAGLWMLVSSKSNKVARTEAYLNKALDLVKGRVPLSVHWYCWQKYPHDVLYPEYFPVQPGFEAAVSRLEAKGVMIMPYINARIWDQSHHEFATVKGAACRKTDGTPYKEVWNKRDFSAMCQCSDLWRERLAGLSNRILSECGAGSLYFDQIASMKPVVCYADDHGHPVGGGSHWVDGYKRIVRDVRSANPGKPMTSENFAEPYVDVFEGFLTWSPNTDADIPLLPAICSGYCESFGCRTFPHFKEQAFKAAHNRSFIWGAQIGWEMEWILEEKYRARFEHLVRLVEIRSGLTEFFADGEYVADVENDGEPETVALTWERWGHPLKVKIPAVQAALWQARDGRKMIAVANHAKEPRRFSCALMDKPVEIAPGEVCIVKIPPGSGR